MEVQCGDLCMIDPYCGVGVTFSICFSAYIFLSKHPSTHLMSRDTPSPFHPCTFIFSYLMHENGHCLLGRSGPGRAGRGVAWLLCFSFLALRCLCHTRRNEAGNLTLSFLLGGAGCSLLLHHLSLHIPTLLPDPGRPCTSPFAPAHLPTYLAPTDLPTYLPNYFRSLALF